MKSILDKSFQYTSSAHTDIRKTFARIREEQAQRVNGLPNHKDEVPAVFRSNRSRSCGSK